MIDNKLVQKSSPVIWLTGLSGSGKTTIANALYNELSEPTIILDGDILRNGLCKDLGFSDGDRHENNRRVAELAKLLSNNGVNVIVALITPFNEDKLKNRQLIDMYVEVFVDCDIEVCKLRDPKGHYNNVQNGTLLQFTGIDSIYETPLNPELILKTNEISVDESVNKILQFLKSN